MNHYPHCKCDVPCVWRTSKKVKSLGRTFGCCSRQNGNCRFFIWKKDPEVEEEKIETITAASKWLNLDKIIRSKKKK